MVTKKETAKPAKKASAKLKASKDKASAAKSSQRDSKPPPIETKEQPKTFLSEALGVARRLDVDRVLYICGESADLEPLTGRIIKKKTVVASASEILAAQAEEANLMHEIIPDYAFDRFEKINVGLAACKASGKVENGMQVLSLVGEHNSAEMDTCVLTKVGKKSTEQSALASLVSDSEQSAQTMEAVLHIALSLGFEGIEGDPVGSIFVVGDSIAVMEKSKQLTLNPFQGYSEDERNILDPGIRDAVKNFCLLDGAVVVREDGVLLAAGRYLRSPEDLDLDLPLGLGTRNAAAMAITATTSAISFVISKSTGTVRVYKNGKQAAELKQHRRRA